MSNEKPNIPYYDEDVTISRWYDIRDMLVDWSGDFGSSPYVHIQLSKEIADRLNVPADPVREMLAMYTDPIDMDMVIKLSWLLVGNVHRMRASSVVIPWQPGMLLDEWSLCRVTGVKGGEVTRTGLPGFKLELQILSGLVAGSYMTRTVRQGAQMGVVRKVGISKQVAETVSIPYLIQLRFYANIVNDWIPERITYRRVHATESQRRYNRQLYKDRQSIDMCPQSYKPGRYTSCVECHKGYERLQVDRCRLAMRKYTKEPDDGSSEQREGSRDQHPAGQAAG